MDLSSLNVDVLLYLMGFVEPVDRFNLILSGILKGFENVNEVMDLRLNILLFCNVNNNQIVVCSESNIVKLNWGYVVVACAN